MDVKAELVKVISAALPELSASEIAASLGKAARPEVGDWAFTCFKLAKLRKKPPDRVCIEIAERIASPSFVEKMEAIGGYINFFVNAAELAGQLLPQIIRPGADYGKSGEGKGKTIVLDYSSPNIAKPFGIGHLRSTVIGNSLYKIYQALGYRCVGINFLGDWGTQFGMIIADYKENKERIYDPVLGEGLSSKFYSSLLTERYVDYNERTKNNPSLLDKAKEEFNKLEKGDPENREIWSYFRNGSIQRELHSIYKMLGITFQITNDNIERNSNESHNIYSGESETEPYINSTIELIKQKGLTKISEGALIVDLEKFGMPPCLLRKSDGATLYAARDIAAAIKRYETYKFHKLIYVVGADQKLHFRQIFKVLELMGYDWAKDCVHVDFGLVRFKGEKMSTRRGTTILLEGVLNEAIELSKSAMRTRLDNDNIASGKGYTSSQIDAIAQSVGIGALIFNDLKNKRIKDVDFDWAQMLAFDGETGPYLMYTHTRLASILKKYASATDAPSVIPAEKGIQGGDFSLLGQPEEKAIINRLAEFPDIINQAAQEYEPSVISNYLLDLASTFNRYYHYHRIISEDSAQTSVRIMLCRCLKTVFYNGLTLLGITPQEEM